LVGGFNKYNGRPSTATLSSWADKWPNANVAVLTGLSRVVVIDVDDQDLLSRALDLFGRTPLIIQTPRPGYQLWYRARGGESPRNLRNSAEGLAIEVKAGSAIVIVPPSLNPKYGRAYRFYKGDWDCLSHLPLWNDPAKKIVAADATIFAEGERNQKLFLAVMKEAPLCSSLEELEVMARQINAFQCDPPLPERDVLKTAKSAWDYETSDMNFIAGNDGAVILSHELVDRLKEVAGSRFPDALASLTCLLRNHGAREESFAFAPTAMAQKGTIPGIRSRKRLEEARDTLLDCNLIEVAWRSKKRARYRLSDYALRRKRIEKQQPKLECVQIDLQCNKYTLPRREMP
jgi:hypothetical protein